MQFNIKSRIVIACIFVTGLLACNKSKDDDSNYLRARINGTAWSASLITSETSSSGSTTEPTAVIGIFGSERIRLQFVSTDPGTYPFRLTQMNPAVLISFTGQFFESGHRLAWATGTETSLLSFTLETSTDGINWTNVVTRNATGNNSQYEVIVQNGVPAGQRTYYRLKALDTNGAFQYSAIVTLGSGFTASYQPFSSVEKRGFNGSLQITSHDRSRRVISGVFSFSIRGDNGQLYVLDNGEFKVKY